MLLQEQLNIIQNQFGLQVEEIESSVYKVLNPEKEVNIDKLQWALEECMLVTSDQIRTKKLENGMYTSIRNVYIIITKYNKDLVWKYDEIYEKKYGTTLISDYKYKPDKEVRIDTIYSLEEL